MLQRRDFPPERVDGQTTVHVGEKLDGLYVVKALVVEPRAVTVTILDRDGKPCVLTMDRDP